MTKPNEPEGLERYTIHLVAEEASEAIQMTGKWGRFGPDHARRDGLTARAGLALELGDVLAAIDFALCAGLIDPKKMLDQREAKFARLTDPDAVDDEGRQLAPPLPSEAARLYIAPAQPVADAGGVAEDDVIGLINIVTDLAEVDALDKAYPEVWGRLDAMVNHAVAAATAGMPTIWEDPAGKGYPCFERPMTPAEAKAAIERHGLEIARLREALEKIQPVACGDWCRDNKHIPECENARAVLSEAREVGE